MCFMRKITFMMCKTFPWHAEAFPEKQLRKFLKTLKGKKLLLLDINWDLFVEKESFRKNPSENRKFEWKSELIPYTTNNNTKTKESLIISFSIQSKSFHFQTLPEDFNQEWKKFGIFWLWLKKRGWMGNDLNQINRMLPEHPFHRISSRWLSRCACQG